MSLLGLPSELWLDIEYYLNERDLKILCLVCHDPLGLAQSKAYQSVVMTEAAWSGDRVLAIASGTRAQFVRYIEYRPASPKPVLGWSPGVCSEGLHPHDPSIELSAESCEVLSMLRRFPHLETFRLNLDAWRVCDWPLAPLVFRGENFAEYHQPEDKEPWRILLNGSLAAVAASAGAFSKLELHNLPPVPERPPYSAFGTDEWRSLLRGLSSLEIVLASLVDVGSGGMTAGHREFLATFPAIFLSHLPQVEHLRLVGSRYAVIGYSESGNPIDWSLIQMPRLRNFTLEYSYLEHELVKFLVVHSTTLENIHLRRCLAREKANWRQLFWGVTAKAPRQLREFKVMAYPVLKRTLYTTWDDYFDATDNLWEDLSANGDEEEDVEVEDGTRRRFVVGGTCERYGAIESEEMLAASDDEDELEGLDESDVVKEWEMLDEMVKRNQHEMATAA